MFMPMPPTKFYFSMAHHRNLNHSKYFWARINYNVHHDECFTPPVNTAIIIFLTKPVFIKSKYELIDSKHTLIAKICSLYEASVCVGFFMKFKTVSQSKG